MSKQTLTLNFHICHHCGGIAEITYPNLCEAKCLECDKNIDTGIYQDGGRSIEISIPLLKQLEDKWVKAEVDS